MHETSPEDTAFARLSDFNEHAKDYLQAPFSEADTRARFIDPLLFNVLGWHDDPHELTREWTYHDDAGRHAIDYLFTIGEPILVVEAKKNLARFEIPDGSAHTRYKLDGVIQGWPTAWSAITQARAYCDAKGARYCLVTNGHQFIVFQAIREHGGSWERGSALVYKSIEVLRQHFGDFYSSLSRDRIAANHLSRLCADEAAGQVLANIRTAQLDPGAGYRNQMHDVMQQNFAPLLLDIPAPTREFLEECYCSSEDVRRYGTRLDNAIADPMPTFRAPIHAVRPGGRTDAFDRTLRDLTSSVAAHPLIVLMGGVGVGKTVFLQWFFNVRFPGQAKERRAEHQKRLDRTAPAAALEPLILTLDFRTHVPNAGEVHQYVASSLVDAISQSAGKLVKSFGQLREIFKPEIDDALKGILQPYREDKQELERKISDLLAKLQNKTDNHLLRLITYIQKHCNRRIVIVLDNMDQKSSELQNALYQVAQKLAFTTSAVVIVSLRESTYMRLTRRPEGNAYSPIEFHIRPQPLDAILEARLSFATTRLSNTRIKLRSASNIEFEIADIGRFINVVRRSLVGTSGDPRTLRSLVALSNADIRQQLRLVYRFLVSGQTKIGEYFWTYAGSRSRRIPYHEVLHSIILDDRKLFAEGLPNPFMNVFEFHGTFMPSHFTGLRLLHYFRALGQNGELQPADYIAVEQIAEQFVSIGVSPENLWQYIEHCCTYGLLQPSTLDPELYSDNDRFALTKAGTFYADELYCDFTYFGAMAVDTTVTDPFVAQEGQAIVASGLSDAKLSLKTRVRLADLFLTHLEGREQEEMKHAVGQHSIFGNLVFTKRMRIRLNEVLADSRITL